jgi:hypothetical protein
VGVDDGGVGVEGRRRRARSGAVEQAVSGLQGSKSLHGSSGGVKHGSGDREAESGMVASTKRGGTSRRQQLGEVWHQASSVASSYGRGRAGLR